MITTKMTKFSLALTCIAIPTSNVENCRNKKYDIKI